ncbi:MAG: GGDEF domain-containing protein [Sulfurovum sp.]|nr:MAG: GGDEF domain-containing protein [Sulfurovum sp.]
MPYQQKNTVSSLRIPDFQDKATKEKFNEWMIKSSTLQIRLVSALTGLLYMIAALINSLIISGEILSLMVTIHLYVMPPFLFLISLMTFKKDLYRLFIFLLIIAPIAATIGNLFITSKLEDPALYMTELYLIIFWIFTVSGLRLWEATISAMTTVIVIFIVTYFFFSLSLESFVMHSFWMLASFSFGFLGAYLLDRSYKEVFSTHEQLIHLAMTDKLTGLYNRAKLDELLQNELDRAEQFHHTFGLVIMDLDHFKEINDTYGHQAGDTVLREVSQLVTEGLRPKDKVVRWGGEEFLLICAETDQKEVLERVKKLCLKIEQHRFSIPAGITASFGLTQSSKGDTIDSVIKRADDALYLAKNSGRNRIEFL